MEKRKSKIKLWECKTKEEALGLATKWTMEKHENYIVHELPNGKDFWIVSEKELIKHFGKSWRKKLLGPKRGTITLKRL